MRLRFIFEIYQGILIVLNEEAMVLSLGVNFNATNENHTVIHGATAD